MIADYRTALQLIWISSALNLIVPGAEVRGMSIAVCLVLSGSVSALSLSLPFTHTHTHEDTYCMCTHKQAHSELSMPLTNKHKHIKSSSFSALTRSHKHPDSVDVYGTEQTQAHEKCMSLCVFHKKHSSGFHSHLSWNTTQEYQLHWQFGWQCRQEWLWTRIWDPQCHLNERVTVSCSSRANIACAHYKIHVGLNVIETLLSTVGESWLDGKPERHWEGK